MMRKKIVVYAVLLLVFALSGCDTLLSTEEETTSGGSGDSPSVSESEAQQVAATTMSDVSQAVSTAIQDSVSQRVSSVAEDDSDVSARSVAGSVTAQATTTVDYSAAGITVVGQYTSDQGSNLSYTLTATLTDYTTSSGSTTGTFTINGSFSGSTYSWSYDGEFVVRSGSSVYTVTLDWDLDGSGQWSGDYTVNGESFNYGGNTAGGDTSDDGGSTSSGTGVSFYTAQDGTYIDIYVNGSYAGRLTNYFSSGVPSYGASGTVTVSLSAGTHSFTASDQEGVSWGSDFTLQAGEQAVFRLNR